MAHGGIPGKSGILVWLVEEFQVKMGYRYHNIGM